MGVIHLWNISKWTRWQPIPLRIKHFCVKKDSLTLDTYISFHEPGLKKIGGALKYTGLPTINAT